MIRIQGLIETLRFRDDESGYTIAALRYDEKVEVSAGFAAAPTGDAIQPALGILDSAGYPSRLITIVGSIPSVSEGEEVIIEGAEVVHPKFGPQIKIEHFEAVRPQSEEGLIAYLSSGQVKGIGPVTAKEIVKRFGNDTWRIMDESPDELLPIKGISPKKLEIIKKSWETGTKLRQVIAWLQGQGVTLGRAVRIAEFFKLETESVAKSNPYRFMEVDGIGFKLADEIAQKLGVPFDDPRRMRAGLLYILEDVQAKKGNTFVPVDVLLVEAGAILNANRDPLDEAYKELVESGYIIVENAAVGEVMEPVAYHHRLHECEVGISECVRDMLQSPRSPLSSLHGTNNEKLKRILDEALTGDGIELAELQMAGVRMAVNSKVSVLTGGPGTGKTTCLKTLLDVLDAARVSYALASPTGKAAKRLEEATDRPASTIHRLLGSKGIHFSYNAENKLEVDFVVIDESSMLDLKTAAALFAALDTRTHILLVGDVDQLPSVDVGNILTDFIECGVVPVVRLEVIFRQAEQSGIIRNAHRINKGLIPTSANNLVEDDFFIIRIPTPEKAATAIIESVQSAANHYGLDPLRDIQVLAPMKKGVVGVNALNMSLQHVLNPPSRRKSEKMYGRFKVKDSVLFRRAHTGIKPGEMGMVSKTEGRHIIVKAANGQVASVPKSGAENHLASQRTFRLGDKVLQRVNDAERDVYNGDEGYIVAITNDEIHVDFDGKTLEYSHSDALERLMLAYALTIHKAQGSEYPMVIMPMMTTHYIMLQRNLIYTGITRAKKYCVLIGQSKAIAVAVNNNKVSQRHSGLDSRLRGIL